MKDLGISSWSLAWPLLLLAPVLMLVAHWSRMFQLEHYQYLPALAIVLLLLINARWDRVVRPPTGIFSIGLFSVGIATLASTTALPLPWLAVAGWLLVLGSALLSHRQLNGASLGHLWPLSWLLITLPLNLDQVLIQFLQSRSSQLSSYLLDMLAVPHVLLGNVIELSSGQLFVEEACSGVQSVFTLLFLATLLVVGLKRNATQLPFYWMSAIFWAFFMNVVRILSIAYVRDRLGWDWASGWKHSVLGYSTLLVAALLLLSTDRFFRVIFFPTNREKEVSRNPIVDLWNRLTSISESPAPDRPRLGAAFTPPVLIAGCVLLFGGHLISFSSRTTPIVATTPDESPLVVPPEELQIKEFIQVSHEHLKGSIDMPFGLASDVYRGSVSGLPVVIAISQTYPNWHDLCLCYSGIGWKLNEREISTAQIELVTTRWLGPTGNLGYLVFGGFAPSGEALRAPRYTLWEQLTDRFRSIGKLAPVADRVAMVQLFCESNQPLSEEERTRLQAVLVEAHRQFVALSTKQ